jgi:hypothetical protein
MPPLLPDDGDAPAASPRGTLFSALGAGATGENPERIGNRCTFDPGGRMSDYTATAICEGDYWVIDVQGVGTTQADSVDDIEEMAVDLVTAMTHTAPQDVHVQVRIV